MNSLTKAKLRAVETLDRLHWRVSCAILSLLRKQFRGKSTYQPGTIVVLRNCFFGDFIVTIPALRKLRAAFPGVRIVLLTAASFDKKWRDRKQEDDIFHIEPGLINDVVRFSVNDLRDKVGRSALQARIGGRGPTLSLVLCYSGESLLSRLKRVVLCRLLALPFPSGVTGAPPLAMQGWLNRWRVGRNDVAHQFQSALSSVDEFLRDLGISPGAIVVSAPRRPVTPVGGGLLIGIAPFTKQQVKQWPLARFAELMIRIANETGARFEIYGAPGERPQADALADLLAGRVVAVPLCGVLSPRQLRERIEAINLLVCLDSGPMHVASLVGTPVVAIFSQITLHNFWRPWGPNGTVVSTQVPCAQCDTRSGQCPLGTRACIDGISVDEVLQKVLLALGRGSIA